ncbi:hypothetical protein BDL97_15G069300 [Sphagnum fallax]|nr:hypothetical protein BDL97_15G069300 [Sphagnum fallax]
MHGGGNYGSWGANYSPPAAVHHQQTSPDYSNLYTPGAPPYAPPPPLPPPIVPMTHTPPPVIPPSSPYDFPHSSITPAQEPIIADLNSEFLFNPNSYYAPMVPSYNFDNGLLLQGSPGYGGVPAAASLGFEQAGYLGGDMQGGGTPASAPGRSGSSSGGGTAYDAQAFGAGSQGIGEVYVYDGGQGQQPQALQGFDAYGSHVSPWNSGGFEAGASLVTYNNKDLGGSKMSRATPKVDTYDLGGGVQKYRVKLLPDSKDVICQIGLDGVRMLDLSMSLTLRIYPLETIERWEVTEPSVFTFWAKSAVDVEQRTIRLKSSSHTTSAILDTITAACVQLSEMLARDGPNKASSSTSLVPSPVVQRKSSIVDWVSIRPQALTQEEKQHWVPDEAATKCSNCSVEFSVFNRRHHCRNCGNLFCDRCTQGRTALTAETDAEVVRVCDHCLAEVTQRLTNTKDTSNRVPVLRTHEDLAKTLQG